MTDMIRPISYGETRTGKKKDCAVRALANTTLAEYEECEQVLKQHGREINKGTRDRSLVGAYKAFGLRNMHVYGTSRKALQFEKAMLNSMVLPVRCKGTTLGNFIKNNPKGRFVVVYSGHATSVIDGQLVDTFANNPNKRVCAVFSK